MLFAKFVLSYFGLGFAPVASGTFGTFGAALTAWAVLVFRPEWAAQGPLLCGAMIVCASALTVLLTPIIESGVAEKDPGIIVMDEVAGYWATLLFVGPIDLTHIAAAFFVFRLFDIVKPFPANWMERLPSGWGVLLDDVVAGLYGGLLLWGIDHAGRIWTSA